MENHTFSEPQPATAGRGPCREWYVDVYRHASDAGAVQDSQQQQPVGRLLINAETFPPRRRRNKVVWRLPDDGSRPRFGAVERERLWELFKQQKKERRRRLRDGASGDGDGDTETEPTQVSCNGGPCKVNSGKLDSQRNVSGKAIRKDTKSQTKIDQLTSTRKARGNSNAPKHSSNGTNGHDPVKERSVKDETPGDAPSTETASSPAASAAAPCSSDSISMPAPLPPGFTMAGLSLGTSGPVESAGARMQQPPIMAQPDEQQFYAPSYLPPHALPQVGFLFAQLLSAGQARDWLRYYAPHARSSLVLSSARTGAATYRERLFQWQSLQGPWECLGCEVQGLMLSAVSPHQLPPPPDSAVMVVCSGRTRQRSELLVFGLTLVLHRTGPTDFQIVNDVLMLTPI